ncbi:parathyroid hormone/parathyroid hormone-related peptide receptor isoform X2 [Nasonia vitripennis]|uniref:Parathyroid hormone/parathyroid hormone-related peptide receptor n=1 Tax=Nasonia vitripennis TaxID=7425 RepID=A0A7M7IUW3_NASVI|nr:parathyroid hormone/parathyroid hormone-related peptide receptor isoform X2 [Nasonia vitripennis]
MLQDNELTFHRGGWQRCILMGIFILGRASCANKGALVENLPHICAESGEFYAGWPEHLGESGQNLLPVATVLGQNLVASKIIEDGDYNSPSIQEKILQEQAQECKNGTSVKPGWCPTSWDGIICWPSTPPGEVAVLSCPHYIAGFDLQGNATKQCMGSGQWYWSAEQNNSWTNYTRCFRDELVTVIMELADVQSDNVTSIGKYLETIKCISKAGYAVSLSALVVAFCILASIKKLRCQRNILHMHLFASFMVRAFTFLLKNLLFVAGVGLSTDVLIKNGESYWLTDKYESNWHCKAFTSIWQYCILANYSWILMEGLYLHNLIFCALFADSNASIAVYVVLGWGLPAVFVTTWVILRAVFEDLYCWTTHENAWIFQIIRLPTTFSVVINFILFVNIVRVLMSKLKSTVSEDTMRYKRWARSTLVLVPLFGVHYSIFLGMSYSMGVNETVEIVWLFCDQLFASFQGFFVAVLYCFLNGEVRAEVSRALRARTWPRLPRFCRFGARPSTHSGSTCSCNTTTGHKSPHDGCFCWPCCRRICVAYRHSAARHHRSTHSMASTQDIGIGTRGGSLASSRGYLEVAGTGNSPASGGGGQGGVTGGVNPQHLLLQQSSPSAAIMAAMANHKNMDQSLLSFCSNMSEMDTATVGITSSLDKCDNHHSSIHGADQGWSDSECCHLAYELHHLHQQGDP